MDIEMLDVWLTLISNHSSQLIILNGRKCLSILGWFGKSRP